MNGFRDFIWRLKQNRPDGAPTLRQVWALFVIICIPNISYILNMFLPPSRESVPGSSPGEPDMMSFVVYEVTMVLIPVVFFTLWLRLPVRKVFRINPFGPRELIATLLLTFSSMVLISEVTAIQEFFFPAPEKLRNFLEKVMVFKSTEQLVVVFMAVAIMPCIAEELLFRGFFLKGFEAELGRWGGIIFTSVIFGVFHVEPYRILPTALLGVAMAYVVVRTGCIFMGMLLHFCNNAVVVLAVNFQLPDDFKRIAEDKPLPLGILFAAVVLLVVSVKLFPGRGMPPRRHCAG